jgi:arabinoxylan arabinofuranohydrolase
MPRGIRMQATTAVRSLLFSGLFLLSSVLNADNCFITARPASEAAPAVFTWNGEERLYVYCTQDIINGSGVYPVDTIHCYSTTDMFHWRDEGVCLYEKAISWTDHSTHKLWAAHVARIDKIMVRVSRKDTVNGIVRDTIVDTLKDTTIFRLVASEDSSDFYTRVFSAISPTPTGLFTAGPPLPGMAKDVIDPFIFIDPRDTPSVWMSYRHQDTRSLGFVRMDIGATAILGNIDSTRVNIGSGAPSGYMEGSSIIKHNGYYFLVYSLALGSENEMIAYSTSRSYTGPWTYRGKMFPSNNSPSEYTIHAGVCEFKGQWYLFYHNVTFGGSIFGVCRSPGVEYLYFADDSTIDTGRLSKTNRGVGVPHAGSDTIQADRGVVTGARVKAIPYSSSGTEKTGWYIDSVNDGATVQYDSVDFTPAAGNRIGTVFARIASNDSAGAVGLHLDSAAGLLLGTIPADTTGGLAKWKTTDSIPLLVSPPAGVHNLVLVLKTPAPKSYTVNWIGFGEIPEDAVLDRKIAAGMSRCTLQRIARNRFNLLGLGDAKTARIRIFNCAGREIPGVALVRRLDAHAAAVTLLPGRLSTGVYIVSIADRDRNYGMRMQMYP